MSSIIRNHRPSCRNGGDVSVRWQKDCLVSVGRANLLRIVWDPSKQKSWKSSEIIRAWHTVLGSLGIFVAMATTILAMLRPTSHSGDSTLAA